MGRTTREGTRATSNAPTWGPLLTLALLLLPVASAEPVEAAFVADGEVGLPPGSTIMAGLLAAIIEDTRQTEALTLDAPLLRACYYQQWFAEVDAADQAVRLPIPPKDKLDCTSWMPGRLALLSGADHSGWVGFYPEAGSLSVFPSHPASLLARSVSVLADKDVNTATTRPEDGPNWPWYEQRIARDHLLANFTGVFAYEGAGAIKIKGPDVVLHGAGNQTRFVTEDRAESSAPAHERVMRWLVVEFEDATFRIDTKAQVTAATTAVDAEWDGRLRLRPVDGALQLGGAPLGATRAEEWFDGRFLGTITPRGEDEALVRFAGELRSTSMRQMPAPTGPLAAEFPIWAGLLGVGAVVVAGGLYVRHRLRARPRQRGEAPAPPAVEPAEEAPEPVVATPMNGGPMARRDVLSVIRAGIVDTNPEAVALYLECVQSAADEENWAEALELLRAARRGRGEDAGLAATGGFYLRKLGRHEEAIAAYEEAALLGDETGYVGAAISAYQAGDVEQARVFVRKALNKSLDNLEEIWSEPLLADLRDDPVVALALADAWTLLKADRS